MKMIALRQLILFILVPAIFALSLNVGIMIHPVHAAIRQLEEAPGQMVYQSRQTLKDQWGNIWQAIAFKRVRPEGTATIYLRLVAFPGVVEVDHTRPLKLINSLGKTWTANDVSQQIFTDSAHPEPNVAQYDLQPILMQLNPAVPLRLEVPSLSQSSITLNVSPALLEEWRSLTMQS
ncbi:DUF3122 domain-containing protein [Chroogloeocystis siderophila]|uniref:DUF3122 domain-containing protein n=1 Tax=Chroogloeocystis siderophila 5.2 s.c.1 TaxID=247279 RepID=A0A1U7HUF9_9CHRO|nr:DUF3122 domain-containing protein [Chroogloeocystis siderophila]OKH27164.1 hypothetical protein NIES1031_10720 [Chroogloeocystis siderophila 5.2 s.c.1]